VTPMLIAPLAGALADRYGNRPFMVLGLTLQAIGFGWIAMIASPGMSYAELGFAFTVAGVGTSFCFPTVANAVMGSVAMQDAGVASGTNSAMRELGGVFGVAVLASVFAHQGGYGSADGFVEGFAPALWVAVALSGVGIVAAVLTAGRRRSDYAASSSASSTSGSSTGSRRRRRSIPATPSTAAPTATSTAA
jgi:MFS family permease